MEKLESNGITAYIDPGLLEFLGQYGGINVDYVKRQMGGGYVVSAGKPSEGGCGSGCSCG
ncbi:MAG: Fe-S cluster assembly protein HesB [candidate division Zixibacteria bacterium]|nr:Fe-S cluster assembly protein HesB [candidate division Zixibacteria bacterium]